MPLLISYLQLKIWINIVLTVFGVRIELGKIQLQKIATFKTNTMTNRIQRVLSIAFFSLLLLAGTQQQAKAQDITVSYQMFYDNLAPYGQWIYDPEYGNVWVPNEDGDFRPYGSRGHWVMTDYGNTWVSEDPWGWAVYHYGRWTYNPYYGWIWVPGYEWAPAWVSWRYGGGYAGWAPMAPGIHVGMSYYAPDSWWIFMGPSYMYQSNCIRYWYGPSYNVNYIHHTTIINNYYMDNSTNVRYNYGPRAEVIQQVTGRPVQVYRVSQMNRPGAPGVGRNTVSIYRPNVDRATVDQARPGTVMQAPRSVGRGQTADQYGSGRQPAFRQDVQRMQSEGGRSGVRQGNEPGRNDLQPGRTQPDQRNRFDENPQPGRSNDRIPQPGQPAPDNRPQPGRYNDRTPQPGQPAPDNRPQPGRYNDRTPQPGQPAPDNRPQPGRYNDRTPQPSQPTPDSRPQPGNRNDNAQDERRNMQPGRYDNRMDNRSQYQPQSQPQPRQEVRPSAPPQQPQPGSGVQQRNDARQQGGSRR